MVVVVFVAIAAEELNRKAEADGESGIYNVQYLLKEERIKEQMGWGWKEEGG